MITENMVDAAIWVFLIAFFWLMFKGMISMIEHVSI